MPEEKIFLQRRQKKIERLFFGEDYVRADASEVGTINFPERTTESYRAKFLQFIDEEFIQRAKMKIVIDYANGVASTIFPNLLGSLQCEVVSLNAYLDPTKLTRTKEETDAAVKNVSNIVTSLKYDLGCVIDAGELFHYRVCRVAVLFFQEVLKFLQRKTFHQPRKRNR